MELFVLCLLIISSSLGNEILENEQKEFITVVDFKVLQYSFPSPKDEKEATDTGFYNASAITRPYGFAIFKNKVFISMPRLETPVPFSLAEVTNEYTEKGPKLRAFPYYEIHKANDKVSCDNKIVSVFRPNMDNCGQLWVIDTGRILGTQVCPPKIMAFHPQSGKILHKYTFPEETFIPGQSMFSNFVLGKSSSCRKNLFYITDPRGYRIVVYNQATKRSWYIDNPAFRPEDQYIPVTVNGTLFNFPDGIYQINLNKTHVIFHPHASVSEYAIPLSLVNDENVWKHNPSAVPCAVTHLGVRSAQWSASAIDKTGNMFGCYTTPSAVYKWDTSKPYTIENQVLVARNDVTLQFCSNAKILRDKDLFVMTTRLQNSDTKSYNPNEINFRVLKCSLDGLNSGRDCDFYFK
ncbi:Y-e3.2 family protein [Megaselia abdita]